MLGPLTRGGGENVPGIPGTYATRKFTYLARGPYQPRSFFTRYWAIIVKKYSSLMHVIKFESLAKFIFKEKKSIYLCVYLFAIYMPYLCTEDVL